MLFLIEVGIGRKKGKGLSNICKKIYLVLGFLEVFLGDVNV